jgi:hypothetical protein
MQQRSSWKRSSQSCASRKSRQLPIRRHKPRVAELVGLVAVSVLRVWRSVLAATRPRRCSQRPPPRLGGVLCADGSHSLASQVRLLRRAPPRPWPVAGGKGRLPGLRSAHRLPPAPGPTPALSRLRTSSAPRPSAPASCLSPCLRPPSLRLLRTTSARASPSLPPLESQPLLRRGRGGSAAVKASFDSVAASRLLHPRGAARSSQSVSAPARGLGSVKTLAEPH